MTLSLRSMPTEDEFAWRSTMLRRMAEHRVEAGTHGPTEAAATAESVAARLLPDDHGNPDARVWQVLDGATSIGSVWLDLAEGGGPLVIDLALDDDGDAAEVRRLVEDAVRAEGADRLRASVFHTDPAMLAFVDDEAFSPATTRMVLSLTAPPAPSPVELRPMTPEFFARYAADDIEHYALERHRAGLGTLEDMRDLARRDFEELLPDGVDTVDQHLWDAFVGDRHVGLLWIASEDDRCFVYNVVVDEDQRGAGHGRGIMDAGAAWCRAAGAVELGLNVFGHNHVARRLYDRLGYRVVEQLIEKPL